MNKMRDQNWLQAQLDDIWDRYFADVPQNNIVRIEFGRKARTRLGSIKVDRRDREVSVITLNGLFKSPEIPEMVIQATIVHELSHYAHGFNSPLDQRQRHPHAGGVMRAEFKERGLEELYVKQKRWLKQNWRQVVEKQFGPIQTRTIVVKKTTKIPKPFWFVR